MKQNIYDDPAFFANYSGMPRSIGGLDGAEEWPLFRALLPELHDKRVLDLGCGFGWHCRYVQQQGARLAVGVDLSENMLERAREAPRDEAIEYRRCAIEDVEFPAGAFDVVISSLALHYVGDYRGVCRKVHGALCPGGVFVFSVEHPIFTAIPAQQWFLGAAGERSHWPIDNYQEEGARHTQWMADDVIKYHRTVATYVNTLIDAGFRVSRLVEPAPTSERIKQRPDLKDERRRPMFLLIAAEKPGQPPL